MVVERRGSSDDVLHGVVRDGWSALRGLLAASERYLPRHVVREVEGYLGCGDPEGGFAWLTCDLCDVHRLVPFTCKGRGFCPSCGGRRMNERAARWVEELFPHVPVRQWVLTVPWVRRWQLARDPELVKGVLRVLLREVERWYRRRTAVDGQTGSVTVVQRFGSALNLNVHFHALVLDGVYARGTDGELRFHAAAAPTTAEVEELVARVSAAAERWLARRGLGRDDDAALADDSDDAQALLQGLSVEGRSAGGRSAGGRVRRVQVRKGRAYALPPRCASCDGYNLHAGVSVGAQDRAGLERLGRYVGRPPLAKARLEVDADGAVVVTLRTPWSDGTTALRFAKAELVEKLCALVPPPRANTVFYHGVLGARATWRDEVVPDRDEVARRRQAVEARREARKLARLERRSSRSRWWPWADLLERVFAVDGWECPCCGGPMRLQAVVVGAPATVRILTGIGATSGAPPP